MIFWRTMGWLMLVAGFVAVAAETALRGRGETSAFMISAHDLWQAYSPQSLILMRAMVSSRLVPGVWDPLLATILSAPAWLLLGAPGLTLVATMHPPPFEDDDAVDVMALYEELARHAHEEGYAEEGDDMAPSHDERPPPGPDELMSADP